MLASTLVQYIPSNTVTDTLCRRFSSDLALSGGAASNPSFYIHIYKALSGLKFISNYHRSCIIIIYTQLCTTACNIPRMRVTYTISLTVTYCEPQPQQAQLELGPGKTVMAVTTLTFDPCIIEIYLPLAFGARVSLISTATQRRGDKLVALLGRESPHLLQATSFQRGLTPLSRGFTPF